MRFSIPSGVKPIFDFVVQIVFGAVGFLVVFGTATLISVIVRATDGLVSPWVKTGGDYAEKALFAVDLFCFALFILSETLKLIRGLWDEWRNS